MKLSCQFLRDAIKVGCLLKLVNMWIFQHEFKTSNCLLGH